MAGFKRAQLRGSEEIFRQTAVEQEELPLDVSVPVAEVIREEVTVEVAPREPERREEKPQFDGSLLVRLTTSELHLLADAIQRLKYPGKTTPRPSVDEFEMLESLRQKLLDLLG